MMMMSPASKISMTAISIVAVIALLVGSVVDADQPDGGGGFKLQILHSSDNESSFQDPNTLEEKVIYYSSLVNGLQVLASNEDIPSLHLTAGDHTIPGPFYLASTEVEDLGGANGLGDIAIFNAFPNAANGMGNHEFDGGINDFATMLGAADYPFLAVNLDFSQVVSEPPLSIAQDAVDCSEAAAAVAKSCFITLDTNLTVGLIGRAPADFFNVIEDPEINLPGLDFVGGRDPATNQPLESAVPMVLEQVDLLKAAGAQVIVLLDHAQDFTGDPLSASELRGVQVIVAAGSTGFMANEPNGPFNVLRDGEEGDAEYPTVREDSEGETVLVVNSDQLYAYIGHLIVEFDAEGKVIGVDDRSGPIATTQNAVDLLATELGVDSLDAIPAVADVFGSLQETPSIQSAFQVVGTTRDPLIGERADVRGRETNLARLVADSTLAGGNAFAEANGLPAIDVALKNGGGIRDSILGPSIIRLTIQAALAFDNKLALIEITGGQLLAAMENAVSRVPAADGRFPQVANMKIVYDENKPGIESNETLATPSRIEYLSIVKAAGTEEVLVENFVAQNLDQSFTMATNSFLLTGGDGYAAFTVATELGETDIGEQQILEEYIVNTFNGTVNLEDPPATPRVMKFEQAAPTEAPPTEASPTEAPPTETPPTEAPPTEAPAPTSAPSGALSPQYSLSFLGRTVVGSLLLSYSLSFCFLL